MSIFEHTDYREFIRAKLKENNHIRGYQMVAAKAAGCQRSYLSQVLNSHVQLTLDHIGGLSELWELDEDETDYFLELLNLSRAGTEKLRKIIRRRLSSLKVKKENLAQRYRVAKLPDGENETQYYSSWHMSAIHVIVSIPGFQDPEAIAERLNLPPHFVLATLVTLESLGLVRKENNYWMVTQKSLHLPRESLFNSIHHSNWRQRAVLDSQQNDHDGIHYTAIHGLSKRDVLKIKRVILECIDKTREIVGPSKEEELICVSCDLFRV